MGWVLDHLTGLKFVYKSLSVSDGQELLRKVFDQNLYYKEGTYRTPILIKALAHNELQLRKKGLLFWERKRGKFSNFPLLWSRPDSNRCPNIVTISFLHAYFLIDCRLRAGKKQTNPQLSWIILGNSHSLLLQHLLLF